jgi:hypothetical protein
MLIYAKKLKGESARKIGPTLWLFFLFLIFPLSRKLMRNFTYLEGNKNQKSPTIQNPCKLFFSTRPRKKSIRRKNILIREPFLKNACALFHISKVFSFFLSNKPTSNSLSLPFHLSLSLSLYDVDPPSNV